MSEGLRLKDKVVTNYERILFLLLLGIVLWPVWANEYFLTLDGPCHLYNAAVLRDLWGGNNVSFFSSFYELNNGTNPNWFSHIIFGQVLKFFSPATSEKILATLYILSFVFFSRGLILHINKAAGLITLIPFLFVCSHVFQMGFYNFCFSLVFMIATWLFFLKYQHSWKWYLFVPVAALLLLATYLTHPVGYAVACLALALVIGLNWLDKNLSGREFLVQAGVLLSAMLPSFVIMAYFFLQRKGVVAHGYSFGSLSQEFIELTAIVNLVSAEKPFAKTAFYLVTSTIAITLFIKIQRRMFHQFDAFFVVYVFCLGLYFLSPSIAGSGVVPDRLQIIPYVVLPFWLASVELPKWLTRVTVSMCVVLIICLVGVRVPVHKLCSEAVEEYLSVSRYVPAKSTVLPLNYTYTGRTTNGKVIADKNWLFFHAADYLGAQKPLIMLGNYEANTGYFPLLWKSEVNPFVHLCDSNKLEALPPEVDMKRYEEQTGKRVDYVMLLSLDTPYINHPATIKVFDQLNANYNRIYTSAHTRAILYQRHN